MKTIIGLIIIVAFLCVMIGLAIFQVIHEKHNYNNCNCPHCNDRVRLVDYDAHGSRGYICDSCGYICWVSWKIVDKKY